MKDSEPQTEDKLSVRWFVVAKQYMLAANNLLHSPEYSRILLRPVLHLTGHGIEVLLKANLIASGLRTSDVKKLSHDLWALWSHDRNTNLRVQTLLEVRSVWERAKEQEKYADFFTENADELLIDYLGKLSVLHSKGSGHALRYVSDVEKKGPRPYLLAETFLEVADIGLKQPASLRL